MTRDNPNALRSHVLEVCDGADIVESLAKFARSKGRAVSVLSGTGVVADVTLRQPADPPSDVVTLYGRFQILTMTGTILPPPAPANAGGLSIFMGGVEGQVMGGIPIGPLIASGPVMLIATSFANAVFERLPIDEPEEEEEGEGEENGASGKVQPTASQSSSVTSGGAGGVSVFNTTGNGNGGADYPFSGDVMGWGSNSRTPY